MSTTNFLPHETEARDRLSIAVEEYNARLARFSEFTGLECPPDRMPLTLHLTREQFSVLNDIVLETTGCETHSVEADLVRVCREWLASKREREHKLAAKEPERRMS